MASNTGKTDPEAEPHLARADLALDLDRRRGARGDGHRSVVLPTAADPAPQSDSPLAERPPTPLVLPNRRLQVQTRRDFLVYGAGVAAAAAGFFWLLPDDTRTRLGVKAPASPDPRKAALLHRVLSFDDDVAEALYSPTRRIPTYDLSQAARDLRNNYDGQTPTLTDYLPDWTLTVTGLASGRPLTLTAADIGALTRQFGGRLDQVTRLVCVEGWSQIGGWGGLRFADFLDAYPPMPGAKWVRLDSSVNLDSDGNSDPYYVSIDLPTARHPQTLLATHQNSPALQMIPLTVEHGAPLRLLVPMKLGLKNIKAITHITYQTAQPPDYWADRGYSHYDGL